MVILSMLRIQLGFLNMPGPGGEETENKYGQIAQRIYVLVLYIFFNMFISN